MKRIKISLSLILAVLAMSSASAQLENTSKFYVKVYGGYGLLTPGSYRLESSTSDDAHPNGISTLSKKGLGAGLRAGGGIGVIASDFLNIGIDVEYLKGGTLKSNSSYRSGTYSSSTEKQFKYTCLSITPHVIFKAVSKPDYLIYNKLGILLNLPFDLKVTGNDTSSNTSITYTSKSISNGAYKIGLTVGLNVALGVQVRLTEKLRGFGEIFGNYMVLSPKSYTESSASTSTNGAVVSKSTSTGNVTFIKEGEVSYTNTSVPSGIGDGTTDTYTNVVPVSYYKFNMNTIGINIGIAYRF
jgi:hypothetical protein